MRYFPVFILFVLFGQFFCLEAGAQSPQDQLKQIKSSVTEKIDGRDFYIHTIKRGQTLYMISKAYGVEVNDIIRENPGVKEGIKADQKLRIPFPGQKTVAIPKSAAGKEKVAAGKVNNPAVKEAVSKSDSVIIPELPCGKDKTTKKAVYKVALMLPLYLAGVDEVDAENPDPKIFETSKSFQFLPFYEGFRLALDSLEKLGVKIKLYVYDADKDTLQTRLLLKKPELKSMDMIFGLLYHANFQIVAAFAKKNKISLINPISERNELVAGNPYVFKVQPSKKAQLEQLAGFMADAFGGGQVLIIRNGQYGDHDAPDRLKKECQERNLKVQVVESQEAAIGLYSKDKPNYVVVMSDNQEYALDLLRGIYKLRNEYNLTLVGLPNWSAMDGLENEYLVALKTHMMARSFIDYDDAAVKQFVRRYHELYKTDPELLAFQGFDQAYYFLSALNAYGTNIGRCIGEFKMNSLQTRFDFIQTRDNGFENRHWEIYKYENYKLVPVN
ncbi:MAG: ABC transporter substrate-binding protein [Bacteroidetes bacterium]|nr:ABC transporter substrate-binding protein [Bacteroidota bacterium]